MEDDAPRGVNLTSGWLPIGAVISLMMVLVGIAWNSSAKLTAIEGALSGLHKSHEALSSQTADSRERIDELKGRVDALHWSLANLRERLAANGWRFEHQPGDRE
jgi:hypothetical protein